MITRPAVGSVSDLAGWQVFHWCCSFVRARPGRLVAAVGRSVVGRVHRPLPGCAMIRTGLSPGRGCQRRRSSNKDGRLALTTARRSCLALGARGSGGHRAARGRDRQACPQRVP